MYVLLYARLYMCGDVYVNVSLRLLLTLLLTLLPIILLTPFLTPLLSLLLPRYGPMVAEVLNELTDGGAGPLTRLARAMGWGRGRRKKLEEEAYERSVINKQTKSVGYVFIYQLLTLTRPPSAMPFGTIRTGVAAPHRGLQCMSMRVYPYELPVLLLN